MATAVKTLDGYTLEDIVKAVITVLQPEKPTETAEIEMPETHVPKGSVKRYKDISDYPPIMYVEDVKDFTRLGTNKVYELLNHSKCPTIRYGKMSVYRDEFVKFYLSFIGGGDGE